MLRKLCVENKLYFFLLMFHHCSKLCLASYYIFTFNSSSLSKRKGYGMRLLLLNKTAFSLGRDFGGFIIVWKFGRLTKWKTDYRKLVKTFGKTVPWAIGCKLPFRWPQRVQPIFKYRPVDVSIRCSLRLLNAGKQFHIKFLLVCGNEEAKSFLSF